MTLAYLQTPPKQTALLKVQAADFIVKEQLGYDLTGQGEFVAINVRKIHCNTLFVGEKLAQFAGISPRQMSYAGLKDRHAITEQWFCLHLPKHTPDFSQFQLEGVEVLDVTRHQRKIRIGSLAGNEFEILLRDVNETDELTTALNNIKQQGVPNYFMAQRFGRDGNNLTQALRWANGEIQVKDRKKRGFYLSAARSEIFNLIVSARLEQGLIHQVTVGDIVQLQGSQSWFQVDENENLEALQVRLKNQDISLTAALMGEQNLPTNHVENELLDQHHQLVKLMQQEQVKADRRAMLVIPKDFQWQFEAEGLRLTFSLPSGSYATAVVRELVNAKEPDRAMEK